MNQKNADGPRAELELPFIQDVVFYEKRVLSLVSSDSEEVILADQKRLEVDTYARYRIIDPLLFYQTVRNVRGAQQRLDAMTDSSVRRVFGGDACEHSFRLAWRHHQSDQRRG